MEPNDKRINNICMLSTHGYFDPVPQLGRTDTGGQVVYVLQLARALAARNCRVDIYTRWFNRSKAQVDPLPGCPHVRVIRIPAGPWEFIPKETIYDVLPELTVNMVDFIKTNDLHYDLFHGHYVDAGIVTLGVAEAMEKPAFFTAHSIGAWKREQMQGDPVEMEKKYNFKHRVAEELRIFKSVRAQTVTTTIQRDKIEQLYGFTAENIVDIPPGVDVHFFQPPDETTVKVDTKLPDRYILCLSRIDANKGHDLLLKAFDLVRKEIPDVHLVIAGGSPKPQQREQDVLAAMKEIVDKRAMNDRVHIIGYVPDDLLVPIYQQAELFVLPSLFEPFGMTALEAMACGIPVVASQYGGIRNVIRSGDNGLLVDPAKDADLAASILSLLANPDFADRLGNEGYKVIQESYSWEAIATRHLQFYDRFMPA